MAPERSIETLLQRIKAEFQEMPGLRLTEAQARRLWGLDAAQCAQVLAALRTIGFVLETRDGAFIQVGTAHPVKAERVHAPAAREARAKAS